MRSTRSIEIVCWALAALVLVWSGTLLLGARALLPGHVRARLQIETWLVVALITGVLWFTGKSTSPLLNLYLLPVILSALTVGRLVTLIQVAVIAACHLALAAATPGVDVVSLGYASRAIGQLAPFLLVAYVTAGLSADITGARERIERLAQTDALTGLCNQRMFTQVWQREHARAERGRAVYSLMMIDIDKLGEINQQFGHEGGNSAIVLVAQCLQRSIRGTDCAARVGGDEFAVLLPGAATEIAEAVVNRVRHNVYKTTLDLRSRMIRCNVSIGAVTFPKDGHDMRELSNIAERNMYRDKKLRRAPGPP